VASLDRTIEVIHLQPGAQFGDGGRYIDFGFFASCRQDPDDPLSRMFGDSLEAWAADAGTVSPRS